MSTDPTAEGSRFGPLMLWAVVLSGVALRLWRTTSGAFEGDEPFTLLARESILRHGVPVLPSGLLYPYGGIDLWYGALGTALGDMSVFWNRLPNALLGCLAPIVVATTLRRHVGLAAAVVGAAVVAWHPGHVEWSGHVKVYGAQALLVALALDRWLAWALDDTPRALGWFVLWFALATSCHPNMGFTLPAFLGLPLLLRPLRTCLRARTVLAALAVAVLPVLWIVLLRHADPTLQAQMVDEEAGRSLRSLVKEVWYGLRSHGWHSTWHAVPFALMAGATGASWWATRGGDRTPARVATVGLLGWLSTWLALSLLSKHKAAMYLLPALPFMALSIGAGSAAVLRRVGEARRAWTWGVAAVCCAVLHVWTTSPIWEAVLERHPRPVHYDLLSEQAVAGELSLGGGPLPVLLSNFRVDDHMVYGRDFGASTHEVDGVRVDRYLGNRLLPTPAAVEEALRDRPGAWYFVTEKELRTGRVSAELHAWLTARMELVSDGGTGPRVYRSR